MCELLSIGRRRVVLWVELMDRPVGAELMHVEEDIKHGTKVAPRIHS